MPKNTIGRTIYSLISIEKIDTPDGLPDDDWYRYVIGQGTSKIEGLRSGSLNTVTHHAEQYAKELNERFSKGGSTYSPRKKVPQQPAAEK